jgi:hypothetical protein
MLINILAIVTALIYAATSIAGLIKLRYENKLLKAKLRRSLVDCRAFYEIEARLCEALSIQLDTSALALKLNVRRAVREDGMTTPSATPRSISEELAEL